MSAIYKQQIIIELENLGYMKYSLEDIENILLAISRAEMNLSKA